MEIIICSSAQHASVVAARIVAGLVRRKPNAVLGLATGNTPLLTYRELVRLHREEQLDFRGVTTFNLDEYLGLGPDHPASYHVFMRRHLFDHINVDLNRTHIPDGLTADVPRFCEEYERAIRAAGGIDLQILGIGTDGHIGFNEPSSSLASRTRVKTLTPQTRADNASAFGSADDVPQHVITMGIGTILESGCCLMLAFGSRKARIVARMAEGPLTAMVPGSALQLHPCVKTIIDEPCLRYMTQTVVTCNAEIQQLHLAVVSRHYIARIYVAVHDLERLAEVVLQIVCILQAPRYLTHDVAHERHRQVFPQLLRALQYAAQVLSLQILHHQEKIPFALAAEKNLDDVGVLELADQPGFPLEVESHGPVRYPGRDPLDGDYLFEAAARCQHGAKNFGHAARFEPVQ